MATKKPSKGTRPPMTDASKANYVGKKATRKSAGVKKGSHINKAGYIVKNKGKRTKKGGGLGSPSGPR